MKTAQIRQNARQAAKAARPGETAPSGYLHAQATQDDPQAARIRARRGRLLRLAALGCILGGLAIPLAGASSSFSVPIWIVGVLLLIAALGGAYPAPE